MDKDNNDTVESMVFKHNQFEYHGIDDIYPLIFEILDRRQLSEVRISGFALQDLFQCIITKFLVNMTI